MAKRIAFSFDCLHYMTRREKEFYCVLGILRIGVDYIWALVNGPRFGDLWTFIFSLNGNGGTEFLAFSGFSRYDALTKEV